MPRSGDYAYSPLGGGGGASRGGHPVPQAPPVDFASDGKSATPVLISPIAPLSPVSPITPIDMNRGKSRYDRFLDQYFLTPTSERPQTKIAHHASVAVGVIASAAILGYAMIEEYDKDAKFQWLAQVIKPIPAVFLGVLAWIYSVGSEKTWRVLFTAAFFFCGLGDCLLQNKNPGWFSYGLAAFLVGHILFTVSFSYKCMKPELFKFLPFLIIAGCALRVILATCDAEYRAPIVAYVFVETVAAWRAVARVHAVRGERSTAQWLAVLGMVLFIVSDCFLAINKFTVPIPYSAWLILPTYWGGLACLAKSARRLKVAYLS